MWYKKIFFIGVFMIFLAAATAGYAQLFAFPRPHDTRLLNENKYKNGQDEGATYDFLSELDRQKILNFYQRIWGRQGYDQVKTYDGPEGEKQAYFFEKNKGQEKAGLVFASAKWDGDVMYTVSVSGKKPEKGKVYDLFPVNTFTSPRPLDFMPVYPNMMEFRYIDMGRVGEEFLDESIFDPMIGIGYGSSDQAETIITFYKEHMAEYNWRLVKTQSHQGKNDFATNVRIVNPYTKFLTVKVLKALFAKLVPPLTLRGANLTFRRDNQECKVTIYTFPHVEEEMRQVKYINYEFAKVYGPTLVCVYYFYEERT